jgi:YfiH family protein
MMKKNEKDGLVWLQFELLAQFPKLQHGIFLRKGGESLGNFSSLNVSDDVGDCHLAVRNNIEKIRKAFDLNRMISAKQVHGKHLEAINFKCDLKPVCDGMITSSPRLGIMIMHADCQAAIFYDPIKHIIANVHAGWRGSVLNIYRETINLMKERYGSAAENIHVGISPSLGPINAQFINFKTELPREFWEFQVKPHYFDFWNISRHQLQQSGVLPHHIEIAEICTFCVKEDFFSYRREKITGRHGAVVSLY